MLCTQQLVPGKTRKITLSWYLVAWSYGSLFALLADKQSSIDLSHISEIEWYAARHVDINFLLSPFPRDYRDFGHPLPRFYRGIPVVSIHMQLSTVHYPESTLCNVLELRTMTFLCWSLLWP